MWHTANSHAFSIHTGVPEYNFISALSRNPILYSRFLKDPKWDELGNTLGEEGVGFTALLAPGSLKVFGSEDLCPDLANHAARTP